MSRRLLSWKLWFVVSTGVGIACLCWLLWVVGSRFDAPPPYGPRLVRQGELRAIVRNLSLDEGLESCPGDTVSLRIMSGSEKSLDYFCSAYGIAGVRLLTDKRGRHFVLLHHAEGRGTRVTFHYLTAYEFAGGELSERARLLVTEPIGLWADLTYRCSVRILSPGGFRVICRSEIDGIVEPDDTAPPVGQTVLTVT